MSFVNKIVKYCVKRIFFLRGKSRNLSKIFYFNFLGIILVSIAYMISNADNFSFVYSILTPRYTKAISAFDKMHNKEINYILKKGDKGFSEISEIVNEKIMGNVDSIITQIRALTWGGTVGVATPEGIKDLASIELELLFSNARFMTLELYDMKSIIKEKYLVSNLFLWSIFIFGTGIVINIICIFLEEVKRL